MLIVELINETAEVFGCFMAVKEGTKGWKVAQVPKVNITKLVKVDSEEPSVFIL